MSALVRLYPRSWRDRYEDAPSPWADPSDPYRAVPSGIVWVLIGSTVAVRGLPRAALGGPQPRIEE